MKEIKSIYPKAEKSEDYTSRCIVKLKSEHGFDISKTILATSVCSDEINRHATHFQDYELLQMPFQLGGLAGFPFTGLTGFGAFAAHIPDDGCAIIMYGPHIGVAGSNQLGKVARKGQKMETSCCGALVGAVGNFKSGTEDKPDPELDYQQRTLSEQLKSKRNTILDSDRPFFAATEIMYESIDQRVKTLFEKSKNQFKGNKVALVGGIIINTDFDKPDWFEEREFEVQSL